MTSDYSTIREANRIEYGDGVVRYGPMLLAGLYDDRTHFIYELLQNAEDALAGRYDPPARKAVRFNLSSGTLKVSHYGRPFEEKDVRGICGIAESTKAPNAIGRFGIGFKSVYAFTTRPEVHSGEENFAVEDFVRPTAVPSIEREEDETVFLLTLDVDADTAHDEIVGGLRNLGPRALLFLNHIEELDWSVDGGPWGVYLREKPERPGDGVRRVTLIGEEQDQPEVEQTWLVFSRPVAGEDGRAASHVEIAFLTTTDEKTGRTKLKSIGDSRLVVFFPTVLATHLGFLIQGPYRTTPSRDNVPPNDPWNRKLVEETAELLTESLRWLRDRDLLDVAALQCLPLNWESFTEDDRFSPLFWAVREALKSEPLLPSFGGGHTSADGSRMASSRELRELLDPARLTQLFGAGTELNWLSGGVTPDRTPELWRYLTDELGVAAVTPGTVLAALDKPFLEAQTDEWIVALYEFLGRQPGLLRTRRTEHIPLVRLQNGSHVEVGSQRPPQIFLPGEIETGFFTVRREVCSIEGARTFLESLGLTEADPVDDVVWNILPGYGDDRTEVGDERYSSDLRHITEAFAADSATQRDKLLAALRDTPFVRSVDASDGSKSWSRPAEVYLGARRLKELFRGVGGVLFVDDGYTCLRGERVRDLLEACGASRYLQPLNFTPHFSGEERRRMRREAGCEDVTREVTLEDFTLRGLDGLLELLPRLEVRERSERAARLWEALGDLVGRRARAFEGYYVWTYYQRRSTDFDSRLVRRLNGSPWIPDDQGTLQSPGSLVFEHLGWQAEPYLLSKIRFKPPIVETLAREVGIESGVLDLLKRENLTSVGEFMSRLSLVSQQEPPTEKGPDEGASAVASVTPPSAPDPRSAVPEPEDGEPAPGGWQPGRQEGGNSSGAAAGVDSGSSGEEGGAGRPVPRHPPGRGTAGGRTRGRSGTRPFISYVGTHPEEPERDPDGLQWRARMALEEEAIRTVLEREPQLRRTPPSNPGYDLYEVDAEDRPRRWIEIKAMTGTLQDRPAAMSRTQFEYAREKGDGYWLYVVERAGAVGNARIVRIRDPADRARSFTFDRGWVEVAEAPDGASGENAEYPDAR